MKKIRVSSYFLLVTILTTSMATFTVPSFANNTTPQWKKFFQRYFASVTIGALVGVSTDIITKYLLEEIIKSYRGDKKIEATVLADFFIGPFVKFILLKNIKRDMLKDNIPHKDSLMFLTAYCTPFRGFLKHLDLSLFGKNFFERLLTFAKASVKISFFKIY